MEREIITTNRQVMHWVESGHYHHLGAYCTGYFAVIDEYYKRVKKGIYSYIQAEDDSCVEDPDDYCNYKFTYDIDTFLSYMLQDQTGRDPIKDDLDAITTAKPELKCEYLSGCDCKIIRLLRFAIEDRDKLLINKILESISSEDE